nr:proton-conducting transporter membrane subunit [Methanolinea mesophila]
MITLQFLILFPAIIALLLFLLPRATLRDGLVRVAAAVIILVSASLLVTSSTGAAQYFPVPLAESGVLIFLAEMLISAFLIYMGFKYRNTLAVILVAVQATLLVYYEAVFAGGMHEPPSLFIDQFSLIMALIIGIIGTLIGVYALGYMKTYHDQHPAVKDRQKMFFFVVFLFLSAMFGLVFSDSLLWVFFFWEITTLCSFLLIGYSGTAESIKNAFLALNMNLAGGIAFAVAILYLSVISPDGTYMSIRALLDSNQAFVLVPAVLLSFAGITKAALMPFSSWLVGAMVAPTPVSALLHSSTMVKAGVYIIVRFSPVLSGSIEGLIIALIGGFTFLLASAIAISQRNAKKVLAYSTIANLGLIVACAGVGTYKLVWAAILLILFHAIAKSLLFLCVGTVEQRIGSKDIEDMSGLIVRLPKVAVMMFIGIAGMFLAPFGMLISKYVALEAFVEAQFGLIFVAILAFGGSITVFFWSKWMGKIISVDPTVSELKDSVHKEMLMILTVLTGLTVLVTLLFPVISASLIEPFVLQVYGHSTGLSQDNLTIMVMMLFLLMIMPLSMLWYGRDQKTVPAYMGGRPATAGLAFAGSMGVQRQTSLINYYFVDLFGERRLLMAGTALCFGLVLLAGILAVGVVL